MADTLRLSRILTLTAGLATALVLSAAVPANAAATDVARWNLGDSGSTMSDATGRGHTGTLHSVTVRQPGVSGGYGYGFSKHPAYVSVPTSADFRPGTGAFQISLNIKTATLPSASVVDYDLLRVGLGSTSGGSYKVEILINGRAYCNFRGSSGEVSLSAGPNLADNRWHSITCRRSGSTVTLTVDGSSWSKSGSTGTISNNSTLYIGAKDGGGADQYTGLMDYVRIAKG
ncbi:Concanavalin A-like lectin/glucanases superfamily protein [Modestobacter sp. DSM 44400]|uniref:laminin G domain-containing protein n=1 Tax=Modestobacter sp. DSM 44400 TaxID=1550230 RepID=UPI000896E084|nr:laminin G domain-containing protein [Modestobacter sp. DSM 44400]SDY99528.1 Concanavalin A-like lectin/glucanases superfamily protein [Modestobacter sp. DSM 44400]